jgi:hypothetical protein
VQVRFMHEDGIGMARTFEMEFHGQAIEPTGPRAGFFSAVDLPSNPAAYTGLRPSLSAASTVQPVQLRSRSTAAIGILTGEMGARVLAPLVDSLGRTDIRVIPVRNDFFGGNTAVTGLMTGTDLITVLDAEPVNDRYLLPDVCLSEDGRFLDGKSVSDLPRTVEIIPTDGIALKKALEAR